MFGNNLIPGALLLLGLKSGYDLIEEQVFLQPSNPVRWDKSLIEILCLRNPGQCIVRAVRAKCEGNS